MWDDNPIKMPLARGHQLPRLKMKTENRKKERTQERRGTSKQVPYHQQQKLALVDETSETYSENCNCIMVCSTSKYISKMSHKQKDRELLQYSKISQLKLPYSKSKKITVN